jgi:flagellar motor switch protein FliN/FliY
MAETEQAEATEQEQKSDQVEAQNVEFSEAQEGDVTADETSLDILLDITMPITVNLGKVEVPFKRLLQLGPGSVLQLDKTIGQPAELCVQGIKFATGDIVVVDGCYAVRMKEVLGIDPPAQQQEQQE